jgi:DNA-binding protein H-NS
MIDTKTDVEETLPPTTRLFGVAAHPTLEELRDQAPGEPQGEAERSEAHAPEGGPEPSRPEVDEDAAAQAALQEIIQAEKTPAPIVSSEQATIEDLRRQQEALERQIKERELAEKREVIAQIVKVVKDYHVSVEDLVEALGGEKIRRKGVKAKIKYRDPVSGALWSGRGKEPLWIRGKDRTKFLIKP